MMTDDPGEEGDDERAIELSSIAAIYPELVIDSSNHFSASINVQVEPIRPLPISFANPADGVPFEYMSRGPATLRTEENGDEQAHRGGNPFQEALAGSAVEELVTIINEDRPHRYAGDRAQDIHYLSHLPPIVLRISLPEGYPADVAPTIDLHTTWLPKEKEQNLKAACLTIWEGIGRDQVVFAYIDHLREAAENGFDLAPGEHDGFQVSSDLKVTLLDFDLRAKRAKFEHETFECGICLGENSKDPVPMLNWPLTEFAEPKKGSTCHRLVLCSHVFCVPCLQDFYNTCITEGDIGNVKCLAPDCGADPKLPFTREIAQPEKRRRKKDRTLEPSELLQIPLEQETVQRYIKLKRKKRLESDRNTVYCPRQWCQGPARSKNAPLAPLDPDADSDTEAPVPNDNALETLPPPAERLAICEDCTFAFCRVCKASWHGEYYTCFPRSRFELTAEERASEDYMKLHTQPCPTCDARAQKTHGCNHMICFKCDTHFCYLCGSYLDRNNPYQHYNTRQKGCYMRLWELEGGDDGDFGQRFGGGADGAPVHFDSDDDDDEDSDDGDDGVHRFEFLPAAPGPPPARQAVNRPPGRGGRAPRGRGRGHAPPPHPPPPPAAAAAPQRPRQEGLQRFLQMVQDDEEDEWDSDEMDEEAEVGLEQW